MQLSRAAPALEPSKAGRAGTLPAAHQSLASLQPSGPRIEAPELRLAGVSAVRDHVSDWIEDECEQTLWVASLDEATRCKRMSAYRDGVAELDSSLASILRDAVQSGGAGLIALRRNSRGLSVEDRAACNRLSLAAEALSVTLLDYLVFESTGCLSMRRAGYL